MLRLYSDGFIAYGMRFTSTLACHMNLRHYPLDSQKCTIEIESYGYTMSEVLMSWRGSEPVRGVATASIPQFSIVRYATTKRMVRILDKNLLKYLKKNIIIINKQRKLQKQIAGYLGYLGVSTYLPCILIVMLSWVSFWINHEATSARVALGITTVLTMTTISTGVRQSLPRISYVKSIDIYLVMCFVFVFAALLEYAAVNYSYWGRKARRHNKQHADVLGLTADAAAGRFCANVLRSSMRKISKHHERLSRSASGKQSHQHQGAASNTGGTRVLAVQSSDKHGGSVRLLPKHHAETNAAGWDSSGDHAHGTEVTLGRNDTSRRWSGAFDDSRVEMHVDEDSLSTCLQPDSQQQGLLSTPKSSPATQAHSENRQDTGGETNGASPGSRQGTTAVSANASKLSRCRGHRKHSGASSPQHQSTIGTSGGTKPRHKSQALRRMVALNRAKRLMALPAIRDISVIDQYSRTIFPSSFVIFNTVYWTYYALIARKITDHLPQDDDSYDL